MNVTEQIALCICRTWVADSLVVDPSCPAEVHGPVDLMGRMVRAQEIKTPYPYRPAPWRIRLTDGKYTFRKGSKGDLIADRYGQEGWREFLGDKAVGALFDYALELQTVTPVLIQAVEHLLTHYASDAPGHETYREALDAAKRLIDGQKP